MLGLMGVKLHNLFDVLSMELFESYNSGFAR